MIFRFIPEKSTALSALQAGEIDWTDSIPPQRVNQLKDDDSVNLAVTPSNDYWYLALNEARKPWNDVRVRQAIAYANRPGRHRGGHQLRHRRRRINSRFPKAASGTPTTTDISYDIEQAKRLLHEAERVTAEPRHVGHHRVSGDGHRRADHRG